MLSSVYKILGLLALVVIGAVGLWMYQEHYSASMRIKKLEEEKQALETIVVRLSAEKRVAEVLVREQKAVNGVLQTNLLFVEYTKDGKNLPPKWFTIEGKTVHVEAMVIKFERDFVKANDPLRGHSIALFTRIYGDHQNPADAPRIDPPDRIPDVYQGSDPRVSDFELALWKDFWRLFNDDAFRKEKGVRAAHGEEVWGMFEPNLLYTVTIESSGGLTLKSEPLKGIYREALKLK